MRVIYERFLTLYRLALLNVLGRRCGLSCEHLVFFVCSTAGHHGLILQGRERRLLRLEDLLTLAFEIGEGRGFLFEFRPGWSALGNFLIFHDLAFDFVQLAGGLVKI